MYFITTMCEPVLDDKGWPEMEGRCFGYYETFEVADAHLRRNMMDLHECRYVVAVIEKIGPGIHAYPQEMCWYRYNLETDIWEPAVRPEVLKSIIGFAGVG